MDDISSIENLLIKYSGESELVFINNRNFSRLLTKFNNAYILLDYNCVYNLAPRALVQLSFNEIYYFRDMRYDYYVLSYIKFLNYSNYLDYIFMEKLKYG